MATPHELRKLMESMDELPADLDMNFFKKSTGLTSLFAPTTDEGVLAEEANDKALKAMTCEDGSCADEEEEAEKGEDHEEEEEKTEEEEIEQKMEHFGITMFATPSVLGPEKAPGSKASKKRWARAGKHTDDSKKESVSSEEQQMNRIEEMKRLAGILGEAEGGAPKNAQASLAPKGGTVGEISQGAAESKKERSVGSDKAVKAGAQTSAAPKGGVVGEGPSKAAESQKPRSVGSESAAKAGPQTSAAPKGGAVGEISQASPVSRKVRQVEHVQSVSRAKALLGEK